MDPSNKGFGPIIEAAREAVDIKARITEVGGIPLTLAGDKIVVHMDLLRLQDERAETPRRRQGTAVLTDEPSFIGWTNYHKGAFSSLFADEDARRVKVVVNYDSSSGAGWQDHTASYTCALSTPLKAWMDFIKTNPEGADQQDLAKFLRDRAKDIASAEGYPAPAAIVALSKEFKQHRQHKLVQLIGRKGTSMGWVDDKGTTQGDTEVPEKFLIAIPLFEGGADTVKLDVYLDYDTGPEGVLFKLEIVDLSDTIKAAFKVVYQRIAQAVSLPVYAGSERRSG